MQINTNTNIRIICFNTLRQGYMLNVIQIFIFISEIVLLTTITFMSDILYTTNLYDNRYN